MSDSYWKAMAERGDELPLMPKPCHDCAVTTGFYGEMIEVLKQQPASLHDAVLHRWFCHNATDKACAGARNEIEKSSTGRRLELELRVSSLR